MRYNVNRASCNTTSSVRPASGARFDNGKQLVRQELRWDRTSISQTSRSKYVMLVNMLYGVSIYAMLC